MKNIIIFATKYGCAEKAANLIKEKLEGQTLLVNIMKDAVPSLDEYDTVILGGSIYVGRIQKELTGYITANVSQLLQKCIGLFICAGSPDVAARAKELESVFPREIYEHAICKEVLGYEINFEKMNFFDRIILRMVKGDKENVSEFSKEKVESFASAMASLV